jgi:hypothetical protein
MATATQLESVYRRSLMTQCPARTLVGDGPHYCFSRCSAHAPVFLFSTLFEAAALQEQWKIQGRCAQGFCTGDFSNHKIGTVKLTAAPPPPREEFRQPGDWTE